MTRKLKEHHASQHTCSFPQTKILQLIIAMKKKPEIIKSILHFSFVFAKLKRKILICISFFHSFKGVLKNDSCGGSSSGVSKIPLKVSIIQPSSLVMGPNVKVDTETISKKGIKNVCLIV